MVEKLIILKIKISQDCEHLHKFNEAESFQMFNLIFLQTENEKYLN